jgi:hypothetical protein
MVLENGKPIWQSPETFGFCIRENFLSINNNIVVFYVAILI